MSSSTNNDKSVSNPNEKLKRVIIYKYKYFKNNKPDKEFREKLIKIYSKEGQNVMGIHYNVDGSVKSKIKLKYDKNGDIIGEYVYSPKGKLIQRHEGKFDDSKGYSPVYISYNSNNKVIFSNRLEFNNSKTTQLSINFDAEGKMTGKTIFIAGTNEVMQEMRWSDMAGYPASGEKYIYNRKGQHIRTDTWLQDEDMYMSLTNMFDKFGMEIKSIIYSQNGSIEKIREYKYYDNGKIKEKAIYKEVNKNSKKQIILIELIEYQYKYW